MAKTTERHYSRRFLVKNFTSTLTNDDSEVHPEKVCNACKAKLYRLSNVNDDDEAVERNISMIKG